MEETKATQPSYVLWLIRQGMRTRDQLEAHFRLEESTDTTERTVLDNSIDKLINAELIALDRINKEFRVTPLLSKIQLALGISIAELAKHSPSSSMLVSPIFGVPSRSYQAQVFVA